MLKVFCATLKPASFSVNSSTYVEKFMRQGGNLVQIIEQRCRIESKAGQAVTMSPSPLVTTGPDEDGAEREGGVGGVHGQGHHLIIIIIIIIIITIIITWSPTRVKGRMSVKATLLAGMTSSVVLASPVLPEAEGIPAWSRGMNDISTEIMRHEVKKTDDGMMEIIVHECGCSVIISR